VVPGAGVEQIFKPLYSAVLGAFSYFLTLYGQSIVENYAVVFTGLWLSGLR